MIIPSGRKVSEGERKKDKLGISKLKPVSE
jgi:hypothetical protein